MQATWNLMTDSHDSLPLPPQVTFLDTLRGLRSVRQYSNRPADNYSFCILEYGDDYVQCAVTGRDFDVEYRRWGPGGSFTHYVFYHLRGLDGPASADRLRPRERYLFTAEETAQIYSAYYSGGSWPEGVGLEDITRTFH